MSDLDSVEIWPLPAGTGPEDVAVDLRARLVTGGSDGQIWRWPTTRHGVCAPEAFAHTGGRPLGIEVDPRDGSLIVCDAERGLLRVRDSGTVETLAALPFANNAAITADGVVYFSQSSTRFGFHEWQRDLVSGEPHGRLLRYDPAGADLSVIADGLYFPNGVALTRDETGVLLVETATKRLLRFSTGSGARTELATLPAYPDNMSAVGDGTYWIALPTSRAPGAPKPTDPSRYGLVTLVNEHGGILRTLYGTGGRYRMVTGVRQDGEALWLGSLTEPGVARVPL